ncbi:MAG: tRNA-dihydrouridine synthase [Candidatus Nomurabacteria bacterium]|jgi:tRNA-dihydrouridine synthase|nr:tRNA-dihydrouridine synthase [Candidatus Nomurabacteria bacterium]
MNFWNELKQPFFALAPMEDVTNAAFRAVVNKAARPDVFFTEFMSVDGFCHPAGRESALRRLKFSPTERPIVAQIWGKEPEKFSLTAKKIAQMGFDGIDINMGCPDKSVVKSGGGSALIENPELAVKTIQAVKKQAGNLPVSVKTRLGARSIDEWQSWLKCLLEQDIANLTIHLRSRKEMSKVPAHYELIDDVIKMRDEVAPRTLITINGDIEDRAAGLKLVAQHSGVNGVMIGRGIFHYPFCFEKSARKHARAEYIELLKYHLDAFDELTNNPRKYQPLKKFFKIYVRDFIGAKELREKLMQTKTTAEAREIIAQSKI